MAWDPVWQELFSTRPWGMYPGEDLIRFVARNFYSAKDRAAVRFLEVGSGTGANLWFLAREGFSAHGIEGSQAANDIARRRLEAECPGWDRPPRGGTLRTGDMLDLQWGDATFDGVIDSEAVYCNDFDESCRIYREMHRVTRPGGRIFVRTFASSTWGDGTGERLGQRRYVATEGPMAGKGASRFTDRDEIAALLGPWRIESVDRISRSVDDERHAIVEWIVQGVKA